MARRYTWQHETLGINGGSSTWYLELGKREGVGILRRLFAKPQDTEEPLPYEFEGRRNGAVPPIKIELVALQPAEVRRSYMASSQDYYLPKIAEIKAGLDSLIDFYSLESNDLSIQACAFFSKGAFIIGTTWNQLPAYDPRLFLDELDEAYSSVKIGTMLGRFLADSNLPKEVKDAYNSLF